MYFQGTLRGGRAHSTSFSNNLEHSFENKIKSNKQGGVLEEELKHLEKGTEEIINSEIVVPPTTESRNLKI